MVVPAWTVELKHSAIDDLESLGPTATKAILRAAKERLTTDPLATTRHLKSLKPNAIAQRQLSVRGRYRVLFSVDTAAAIVTRGGRREARQRPVRARSEVHCP